MKGWFTAFLLFVCFSVVRGQVPGLYINEVSQGPSGSKEYVELIVVGTPTCYNIPTLDLRGWYIDDNNGLHATGSGVGIAQGCVRFSQDPLWAAVPIGTLIVIHNDADLNAAVPATDLSMSDGNCKLVIPVSNCALLERHTSLPSTASATYPTTGFTSCGSWTNISMANGDDSFQTVTPSGVVFHSVSWGNNTLSTIIYFAGSSAGTVALMTNATNNNITTQANWTRVAVAGNENPGFANNTANQNWICSMNNGCVAPTPIIATETHTNASCTCTGSATISASGGFTGCGNNFTYTWAPSGGNTATATGLCAGTYTCTVTDIAGCSATVTVNITSSSSMSAGSTVTPVSCFGGANGSATVTPSGGTGPYTYSWAPSGGTSATATGLGAGTYTVTITDATSCTATVVVTITQPPALSSAGTQNNIFCNGQCTGSATVTPSGGTGPYTYSWAPSGGTGATASALCAGVYTVTVTDAGGCITTRTFSITQPVALTASTASAPATCGNSNGSATVTPAGGTGSYTYNWAPSGGNASSATNIGPGTYTVTVTDVNGCTTQATTTVGNTPGVLANVTSSANTSCFAGSNGSATVAPSGGTGPYTYSWAPSGGTSATATGLSAGTYTATITDTNGCIATATVQITQPPVLLGSVVSQTNPLCFGNNNGSATITNTGGTGPFTYAWSPSGGTGTTANGLTAGTYTTIITDVNGCTAAAVVTLTDPPVVTVTAGTPVDVLCNGNATGSATVTAGGGTGVLTYAWLPSGGTGTSASGLNAGTYTVTVTDANGCSASTPVTITEPPAMNSVMSSTPATCSFTNGTAGVAVSGGTGTYTYVWAPNGGTAATASGLGAGNYTVTITDSNGCVHTDTTTITSSSGITVAVTGVTDVLCAGDCNGQATIAPSGGTSPYSIVWPSGGTGLTETGLCAGTYTVNVTDAAGCLSAATVTVTQPLPLAVQTTAPGTLCIGQSVTLAATTSGGTPAYTELWAPSGPVVSPNTTTTYTVVVTDANGCTAAPQTVTVTVNPPLSVIPSAGISVCAGGTAALSAIASGGNGNYMYSWSPATNPATGSNVNAAPGTTTVYTVTVTDGCGTPAVTASITVTVLPLPVVTFAADNQSGCAPLCVTFTNTTVGAVSCAWDLGDNTAITGNCNPFHCYNTPGSYDVTLGVTDANGCAATSTLLNYITVYPQPLAAFSFSPQTATLLDPLIHFTDESVGASAWSWDFGDLQNSTSQLQHPEFTYSDSGHFDVTLTVTNVYGCSDDTTMTLEVQLDNTFYAPNCFTPEGDGLNDYFYPKGTGINWNTLEMLIFDRWGNLIYETHDIMKPWDGRVQGKAELSQIDVYVWVIRYETLTGQSFTHRGHVSLIR